MQVIGQLDSRATKIKTQVSNFGVLIYTDLSFSSHIKTITSK